MEAQTEKELTPQWVVKTHTDANSLRKTAFLIWSESGQCFHEIHGPTAEDSLRTYANTLNKRGVKPPPSPAVKTGADGFKFKDKKPK